MTETQFQDIDRKWQKKWEKEDIFGAAEDGKKKKFYCLEMYPYPSASGLHMGHAFNYVIGDIYARFKMMHGFSVLHPAGYDSFGLPAENAAIKAKSHPRMFTDDAIANFILQQKALGLSYDWSRKIQSHDSEYYKWNQYFFLQFLKNGLAYRKKAAVNWCSKCNTVLANEQVHDGKCWRHAETEVEIKQLEQWFLKTTAYADELLEKVRELDWPERIKVMQENWIGKSYGTEIVFEINKEQWTVFTTRPDTLFGVTFMVISAQHPALHGVVTAERKKEVDAFLKKLKSTKQEDLDTFEKEGVFTGSYAIHPLTQEKIPVWAGNFVVADYGSGMVMAVPAHDQRDFEFAQKYKIPVTLVIQPADKKIDGGKMKEAYTYSGVIVNSGDFNELSNDEAKEHITAALASRKLGKKVVQYKLRDWLISRQRYWGTPIPIIYCDKCGAVPVPEKELPVLLPESVKFGEGNPLATSAAFVKTTCPKCGGAARRETDTMDTFFDSSWYYLRFCDAQNAKEPFDKKKAEYWMPVDFYTGGAEHACMHLIYARFFSKVLRDLGYVKYDEPFTRLFNQGMIHGEDGFVMSKSRGNIVDPMEITKKYGADALRIFLVSIANPDKDFMWSSTGLESSAKFLRKAWEYAANVKTGKSSEKMQHAIHLTLKYVSEDIEYLKYNLALIKIRELFDRLETEIATDDLKILIRMLAPFCPHIAEELWEKYGGKGFASLAAWPEADEKKIRKEFEEQEAAEQQLLGDIKNILNIVISKGGSVNAIHIYTLPQELSLFKQSIENIKKALGKEVYIYAVNDAGKHDPQNKAAKAKPKKPAIYME